MYYTYLQMAIFVSNSVFQTKAADLAATCPDQRERAEDASGIEEPEKVA